MKSINKIDLGNRINAIRVNRKETLEEFAENIRKETDGKVKTTKSNVSKWEKGNNVPNDITLKAIATLGRTTVDYLKYGPPSERAVNVAKKRMRERVREDKFLRQMNNTNLDRLKNTVLNAVLSAVPHYVDRFSNEPSNMFYTMFDDYFSSITDTVIDTELKMPSRNDKEVLDNVFEILLPAFVETTNIIDTIEHSGFQGEITDETIKYLQKVSNELYALINQTRDRLNN